MENFPLIFLLYGNISICQYFFCGKLSARGKTMNFLDIVKKLCKENNISISKMEKDIGISKGASYKWNNSKPSLKTINKIAEYFGVTVDYLITGEKEEEERYYLNPETSKLAQEVFDDPELRILFDASRDLSPEDLQAVITMVKALQRKEKGENDF